MLTETQIQEALCELGPVDDLFKRSDVQDFQEALDRPGPHAGRYRSWARGQYHEPRPAGLSLLQLEALVFAAREKTSVVLDLAAFDACPMRLNLSAPTREAVREVADFKAQKGSADPTPPSTKEWVDWQLRSLIEEAFASSAIEGAVTSRKIASDLAREKRKPRGRSEQMILNNWRALRRLDEWQEEPLSASLLCEIQAVITKDTGLAEAEVGALRTTDDIAVIEEATGDVVHQPPPARELSARLERLARFASEDQGIPHLVRAILIHHQIAFDHPFVDGNGRTARLAFMLEATRDPALAWLKVVPFSRAIAERKDSYYQAFRDTAEERWDTTHFVRNQLRCLAIESERLADFLMDFERRRARYEKKLGLEEHLNGRQVALIRSALKPNSGAFTQGEHALHHQVTAMTAGRDLARLVKLGLLSKRRDPKDARRFLYWPTKKLRELE